MQKLTNTELPEGMVPKVKSSKFRNDIKDFSHDKMGMNIAILAAEVLLDFVEGKDDELWDRIAALEKYRERYLRNNEDTHRSQLFIKILAILSKYNYDRNKFLEKAEPYLAEMRAAPLQLSNQAHELEIVPYEQLVQAIATQLNRRWGQKMELPFGQRIPTRG
jgi:NifU-like protein involved in Fe-S cluster formation